jgi:hypothetical protein
MFLGVHINWGFELPLCPLNLQHPLPSTATQLKSGGNIHIVQDEV